MSNNENSKSEEKCNSLIFSELCQILDKLEDIKDVDLKFKKIFNKNLKKETEGQSIFPLMRLIIPQADNERGNYGLKESGVAKTYVDALHLDKKSSADAQRLIHWKDPAKASWNSSSYTRGIVGDFCSVLESVLLSRITSNWSTHTLKDVNDLLDNITKASGREMKAAIVRDHIINQYSAREQKWLMRIIFHDLKIGLKYEQVLKRFYPNALKRFNECTNLRKVCEEEGMLLEHSGIQIFTPFQPMLAKGFPRSSSSSSQVATVENCMNNQPFVMDIKLDGERMMIHISNNQMMIFSRVGTDSYTSKYNKLGKDVMRHCKYPECILDGEICAWDNNSQNYMKFGHNAEAAREEEDDDSMIIEDEYPAVSIPTGTPTLSTTTSNTSTSSTCIDRSQAMNTEDTILPSQHLSLSKWLVYIVFDIVHLNGPGTRQLVIDICKKYACPYDDEIDVEYEKDIIQNNNCSSTNSIGDISDASNMHIVDREIEDESYRQYKQGWRKNGSLIHYPLAVRRDILQQVIYYEEKRIEYIQYKRVITSNLTKRLDAIEDYFNQCIQNGEEGLVIKNLTTIYALGGQSTKKLGFWVKMKPEYGGQTYDLDVIILGAYYGEGTSLRAKGLSTFLFGVRDDSAEGGYVTLGQVGTGYSYEDLLTIREKISPYVRIWEANYLPPHLRNWRIKRASDKPDVWIDPQYSIVLEITCSEIIESTQYSSQLTCRFPRVNRIRYDKPITDIMSLTDIKLVRSRPRMLTYDTHQYNPDDYIQDNINADNEQITGMMELESTINTNSNSGRPKYNKKQLLLTQGQAAGLMPSQIFKSVEALSQRSKRKKDPSSLIDEQFLIKSPKKENIPSISADANTNNIMNDIDLFSSMNTGIASPNADWYKVHTIDDDDDDNINDEEDKPKLLFFENVNFCLMDNEFAYTKVIDKSGKDDIGNTSNSDTNELKTFSTHKVPLTIIKTRAQMIEAIKYYGGTVVAHPTLNTLILAGTKKTLQLSHWIENSQYDVIDGCYILECIDTQQLLPIKSHYYLGYSTSTAQTKNVTVDILHDSYTEELSYADLYYILTHDHPYDPLKSLSTTNNHNNNNTNTARGPKTSKKSLYATVVNSSSNKFEKLNSSLSSSSKKVDDEEEERRLNEHITYTEVDNLSLHELYTYIQSKKWQQLLPLLDISADISSNMIIGAQYQDINQLKSGVDDDSAFLPLNKQLISQRINCLYQEDIVFYIDTNDNFKAWSTTHTHIDDEESTNLSTSSSTPITTYTTTTSTTPSIIKDTSYQHNIDTYMNLLALYIQYYGAQCSTVLDINVTHIVMHPSDTSRLPAIGQRLRILRKKPGHIYEKRIVTPKYIHDCIQSGYILDPTICTNGIMTADFSSLQDSCHFATDFS